jgi:hypothetical protein
MNDPLTAELRVAERLAEMARRAEQARHSRHLAKPAPRLAVRLAVALRGAADLLDSGPRSGASRAAAPVRNSIDGAGGAGRGLA